MAADAPVFYNAFREALGDGRIDLDDDTFVALLCTSSYTPNAESHVDESDLTGELSGNGYSRYTLTPTWTRSGATVTFDADDPTFTASGGNLVFRYLVVLDTTADLLVCYVLLDDTPGNLTIIDGNTGTLRWNASGIFTLSGGAA